MWSSSPFEFAALSWYWLNAFTRRSIRIIRIDYSDIPLIRVISMALAGAWLQGRVIPTPASLKRYRNVTIGCFLFHGFFRTSNLATVTCANRRAGSLYTSNAIAISSTFLPIFTIASHAEVWLTLATGWKISNSSKSMKLNNFSESTLFEWK